MGKSTTLLGVYVDHTPITTQPSSFRPQKKQSRRKQRNETEVPQDETHHDNSVPIPSNDPLLSGEDRVSIMRMLRLKEVARKTVGMHLEFAPEFYAVKFLKMRHIMMTVFLYLPIIHFSVVLDLEKAKDAQAKEIAGLKKRIQKLERKKKSRTTRLKRLRKVGESGRVESSDDTENLGAQEDASKQGRIKIVDETQRRLDDAEMFDIDDLHDDEVFVDMAVGEKQEKIAKIDEREVSTGVEDSIALTILVTTADKGVTAAKIDEIIPTSAPTIVIDELTLNQTLIEIKVAKPKATKGPIKGLKTTWEHSPKRSVIYYHGQEMDFRSFMLKGVYGEFNFLPAKGVSEGRNSPSTKFVNIDAPVIGVTPLSSVYPSNIVKNVADSDDPSYGEDEQTLVGPSLPTYPEASKKLKILSKTNVASGVPRKALPLKVQKVPVRASKVAGEAFTPMDVDILISMVCSGLL
ncbi:hypothetical protein Tco_0952858 [Tanacetum coccineum]|uniref:Uncharacterized protein n=1 Tax=Tanacetum coccineum TaxID=301880 RepID=A0ABQ5E127_9ASTR